MTCLPERVTQGAGSCLAFAHDSGLPVLLDVVGRVSPAPKAPRSYASWLRHSTHCITTSVAEGFGLGFLEPVTLGKPLLGRNLPNVTNDFAEAGIVPGRLYDRLLVPVAWVGLETLRQRLVRSLRVALETYGQVMSNEHVERSFAAMLHRGHLDFGNLPEDLQRQVIHRILAGGEGDEVLVESRTETLPLRLWLRRTLKQTTPTAKPQDLAAYSTEAYTARLSSLYASLVNAKPTAPDYVRFHDDKTTYTGVHKAGGPTTVDGRKDLRELCDRAPADVRGVSGTFGRAR